MLHALEKPNGPILTSSHVQHMHQWRTPMGDHSESVAFVIEAEAEKKKASFLLI